MDERRSRGLVLGFEGEGFGSGFGASGWPAWSDTVHLRWNGCADRSVSVLETRSLSLHRAYRECRQCYPYITSSLPHSPVTPVPLPLALSRTPRTCCPRPSQATLAYLSGNKALAKQLGRKGRELNEAMKAAHAAAARRIFTQRNAQLRSGGQAGASAATAARRQQPRQGQQQQRARIANGAEGVDGLRRQAQPPGTTPTSPSSAAAAQGTTEAAGDVLFVDLHGLHAAEAVSVLETQIEEARAAGCRLLRVCTGTGSHTKVGEKGGAAGRGMLLPGQVEEWI
jgi:DNA-nicking Smr family endonuclease